MICNEDMKKSYRLFGIVMLIIAIVAGSIFISLDMNAQGKKDLEFYKSLPTTENGYKYATQYGAECYGQQFDKVYTVYSSITEYAKYGIIDDDVYIIKNNYFNSSEISADRLYQILGIPED